MTFITPGVVPVEPRVPIKGQFKGRNIAPSVIPVKAVDIVILINIYKMTEADVIIPTKVIIWSNYEETIINSRRVRAIKDPIEIVNITSSLTKDHLKAKFLKFI